MAKHLGMWWTQAGIQSVSLTGSVTLGKLFTFCGSVVSSVKHG